MQSSKINITQKEIDDVYNVILDKGITEETEVNPTPEPEMPDKQDTTPEFLTEEEQEHDKNLKESLNWNEEEDK